MGMQDTFNTSGMPYFNDPDTWFLTLDETGCWNSNCEDKILILNDLLTNLKPETKTEVSFNFYPHPSTSNHLFIDKNNSKKYYISIFNNAGELIYKSPFVKKKILIDCLNYGLNYIVITDGIKKIAIKKLSGYECTYDFVFDFTVYKLLWTNIEL